MTILIGASLMLSLSMGMRQSFGVFMTPIIDGLGISVADYTLALAIQNLTWGVTQPFVGAYADRYGIRPVTVATTVLFALGLVVTLFATGPIVLIIGSGLMVGLALSGCAASLAMTSSARAVTATRRSMVLGIVSAAGSLGTVLAAPLAQTLITHGGWKVAMIGFLVLCLIMLPAAWACGGIDRMPKRETHANSSEETLTLRGVLDEAYRHRGYLTMAMAFFVCGLQLVFLVTHLPKFLALCGQDPMLSAQALATIGAFNVAGCYILGWMGDRFPKHILLGIVYVLRSLAITAYFLLPIGPVSTLIFAAVMGTLWLGVAPLVNGLVAQIFGLRYMATLTGIAFFSHQIGSFLGAWGGGILFDLMGNYDLAWQIGVAIGLIAGVAQVLMDDNPTPRMARAAAPA
jgi:predicted MFS family arabinose efflux permease